ncbi:tetraacyldisaccharide 4'-kinase [[Haemophilus] ducreyi]|uniref:UPF0434 protein HD_0216 n=2 Tax=Haemophilus ducreyi TaxID=730 RepID=Q7VP81_HAEDU|nr:Trm112 family protein [[Haemophilus] ducreyi]AAP95206.1 hypothetical protein HD_0216 [[Haemophilus] ducreyi 35000HP]AKO30358.1 tetraacyldisaccharide 4'-kinase [[Haemophilus] ducreyi]AKO31790.1 tetraacyldisaccharide 4'-kinase [[Haemophilus] ducreyi]AKO33242.1 tetraacyldisaccharide 4'-kinase [[Haemophilus] ducreyi]AKO34692.1 tetraacyldisaccharide 4'-kinase [[Haemophilus] ducreyi]
MNEALLKTIACPLTHTALEWDKQHNRLISRVAQLAYPIQNGIPVLLPEAAEKIAD